MRRCTYIYIYIQEEIIIYIIYFVYIYYRHLYTSCIYNTYTHITIYRIICSIIIYTYRLLLYTLPDKIINCCLQR